MPSTKQTYRIVPAEDDDKIPLRQYVDEASSDEDDLDAATHPQDYQPTEAAAAHADGDSQTKRGSRRPWQRLCCGLQPSNTCLVIAFLFGAVALISLGWGGHRVYKITPKHGQSPPWYPTPRGGTSESWQKSYDKAKEMVERMTLVEKVNVTNGIG